jgi:UDP-glucose:(heptosyl)LPS alpha-1,3-glucosyltransferase
MTSPQANRRQRIAVVSPFIDKRHGTERRVAEWVSRLADEYEIHIYSNRVEDMDLGKVVWHRIPALPGPHLFAYLWWFTANHLWRWRDRRFRGLVPNVVYSPGINCFDADLVTVHVIFSEFSNKIRHELELRNNPVSFWPRLTHRRIYYALIRFLERRIYVGPSLMIGAISRKIAEEMAARFGREEKLAIIYQGIDSKLFNPEARVSRRQEMRQRLGLLNDDLVLLLIGNGWKNKGLPCVLAALSRLRGTSCKLLVVGADDQAPYSSLIAREGLRDRVTFLKPSADVVQFYAAADVYVGPSLYDSFAQPPLEAMACGLPVITSNRNGGSEVIAQAVDGFVMKDAEDAAELAGLILRLHDDPDLRERMGEKAAQKGRLFSWEENAAHMRQLVEQVERRKQAVGCVSSAGSASGSI